MWQYDQTSDDKSVKEGGHGWIGTSVVEWVDSSVVTLRFASTKTRSPATTANTTHQPSTANTSRKIQRQKSVLGLGGLIYADMPNSTTLSGRRQVRRRFEAGRRPAASWNLAYHL